MAKNRFFMFYQPAAAGGSEAVLTLQADIVDPQLSEYHGYSSAQLEADLRRCKDSHASALMVRINCDGGDVQEALAIHDALQAFDLPTRCEIRGNCASAATLVALACDEVAMTPNSHFMVHEPRGGMHGTLADLTGQLQHFTQMRDKVLAIYANQTGMSPEEVDAYLREGEHWLTAEDALAMKWVDSITGAAEPAPVADPAQAPAEEPAAAPEEKPGMLTRIARAVGLADAAPAPAEPQLPTAAEMATELAHLREENKALKASADAARDDLAAAMSAQEETVQRELARRSVMNSSAALADLPSPCASTGAVRGGMDATDYLLQRAGSLARR